MHSFKNTFTFKGKNPLPMPDPGDGPRIDSISHDKEASREP